MATPRRSLHVQSVLWSSRPPRFQYTVLTQLTIDRLPALYNQCSTYTGPMSAAIYFSLVQGPPPGGQQPGQAEQLSPSNKQRVEASAERVAKFHSQ